MSCEPDSQFRNRPHFVAVHQVHGAALIALSFSPNRGEKRTCRIKRLPAISQLWSSSLSVTLLPRLPDGVGLHLFYRRMEVDRVADGVPDGVVAREVSLERSSSQPQRAVVHYGAAPSGTRPASERPR